MGQKVCNEIIEKNSVVFTAFYFLCYVGSLSNALQFRNISLLVPRILAWWLGPFGLKCDCLDLDRLKLGAWHRLCQILGPIPTLWNWWSGFLSALHRYSFNGCLNGRLWPIRMLYSFHSHQLLLSIKQIWQTLVNLFGHCGIFHDASKIENGQFPMVSEIEIHFRSSNLWAFIYF